MASVDPEDVAVTSADLQHTRGERRFDVWTRQHRSRGDQAGVRDEQAEPKQRRYVNKNTRAIYTIRRDGGGITQVAAYICILSSVFSLSSLCWLAKLFLSTLRHQDVNGGDNTIIFLGRIFLSNYRNFLLVICDVSTTPKCFKLDIST